MSSGGGFEFDFHVHTSFSYDCPTPPRLVIEIARWRGLSGVAITDHDTVAGALAALDSNSHSDFLVIPGIEVKSDKGDIIGLYVTRQINNRRFGDVIDEIHDSGGVAYVPHPIRTFGVETMKEVHAAYPNVDVWELYNGRYETRDFADSRCVFDDLHIQHCLCGSDAHFPWEIGAFRTVLPGIPTDAQSLTAMLDQAVLKAEPRNDVAVSAGITLGAITKDIKRGRRRKAGMWIAALPWKVLKKLLQKSLRH